MKKTFNYPPEGWTADSKWDADRLALEVCKIASSAEIKATRLTAGNPFAVGWNSVTQFGRDHLRFINERSGCTVKVFIGGGEIEPGLMLVWEQLVDQEIVFGGPYQKQAPAKGNEDTGTELTKLMYARVSEQAKGLIVEAFKLSDQSEERFMKTTIEVLARKYYPKKINYVFEIFDKEFEGTSLENQPWEFISLNSFISSRTLRNWTAGK